MTGLCCHSRECGYRIHTSLIPLCFQEAADSLRVPLLREAEKGPEAGWGAESRDGSKQVRGGGRAIRLG